MLDCEKKDTKISCCNFNIYCLINDTYGDSFGQGQLLHYNDCLIKTNENKFLQMHIILELDYWNYRLLLVL